MPPVYKVLTKESIEKILDSQSKDVSLDPVSSAMMPFIVLAAANWKSNPTPEEKISEDRWPLLGDAMIQWWKRERGAEIPQYATVRPFGDAARAMVEHVAPLIGDRSVPWGSIRIDDSTLAIQDVLTDPRIDWDGVRQFLELVPAGKLALATYVDPSPDYQTTPSLWKQIGKKFPWKFVPFEKIPWAQIPWDRVYIQNVREALAEGDADAANRALIESLVQAYELGPEDFMADVPNPGSDDPGGAWGSEEQADKSHREILDKPEPKNRDGVDWLIIGTGVAASVTVITTSVLSYMRRKKKP